MNRRDSILPLVSFCLSFSFVFFNFNRNVEEAVLISVILVPRVMVNNSRVVDIGDKFFLQ